MTALREYARLEAMGVWRETAAAQRRDVFVSFGDSSLVISDKGGRALAHWSLAAVVRLNPGHRPALFAPGGDAAETLEIQEEAMVEALEKVRAILARRRPKPGRLRLWLSGTSLALVAGLAVFWAPGALVRHTVSVLPPAARTETGEALLAAIGGVTGRPCAQAGGAGALETLSQRLLGPGEGQIVVVPAGVRTTAHLPGGIILVARTLVEDHESPEVLAGFILAEVERRGGIDPMEALLEDLGLGPTLRLLTSGALPGAVLAAHAEAFLTRPQHPVEDERLLRAFAAARISSAPYAQALDITGETTLRLIEGDPMQGGGAVPVLADSDWVRLQGICGE